MSSGSAPSPINQSPGKDTGFKRVYQACENCRRKKQKCALGDPASPTPPCSTCRRANLPCVLPKQKRKGRPPRASREAARPRNQSTVAIGSGYGGSESLSTTYNDSHFPPQPTWQASMGSFEPVVERVDDPTTPTPGASSRLGPQQLTGYDQNLASQRLATFPLRNTSDAIRLLHQAEDRFDDRVPLASDGHQPQSLEQDSSHTLTSSTAQFFLLEEGLIDDSTLFRLFSFYVTSVHPIIPMIPYKRMRITPEQILTMASQEPHFMSAILVVTASLSGDQALHERLWSRVQSLFAEVAMKGTSASIEVIEGLILLSEYPPNMGHDTGLGFEDRMSWMTVGTAVRLGYLLGLEKLGMQGEDIDETLTHQRDRGKVAWSYCYSLDRQISIRVGKAFWHRSPGMTYQHLHVDPGVDFPEMRDLPGIQDDYAAYLQCVVHITQVFSNAHDLLYPSRSRSVALAKAEHYYKHVDDFAETLSAFRNRWQQKTWRTYPINECVWISFHHLRLYIYSFSLQAYMQRVAGGNDTHRSLDYFPAGLMGSSDARFIVEAINAAALSYLPLRFFLFFSHAAVFLLKAAVIVPLPPSQKRAILRLIRGLARSMSTASSDPRHPGVRYATALDSLLGRIYRDQDLHSPNLTRPSSPHPRDDSVVGNPPGDKNSLSTLLGNRESPFVAERPFQDLASDIDALFGVVPEELSGGLDLALDDLSMALPPSGSLASLFGSGGSGEFWESFMSSSLA